MKYDNVVIGAGVSGMTTALLLAKEGRETILLETSPQIAPTICGFSRNNIYFDTGFHYASLLDDREALSSLFEHLGLRSHLKMVTPEHDVPDRFICTGQKTDISMQRGLAGFTEQLVELFPAEKQAILGYLGGIGSFLEALNSNIFNTVLKHVPFPDAGWATLSDYLTKEFSDPVLQTLFSLHGLLYGSLPHETSLSFHAMIAGGYYDSSQQILGGGKALTKAYEKQLEDNSVTVQLSSEIEKIELDQSGKVRAVVLKDGNVVECNNCIYSGNLGSLSTMLPENCFRPIYRKRLNELEDTLSAIVVYCQESDTDSKGREFGNLMLTDQLFPQMYQLDSEISKRPMFISRSFSSSGNNGLSIICPARFSDVAQWADTKYGRRTDDYRQWKNNTAQMILDTVNQQCGELFGDLSIVDVASPLTFRDYMNAPEGCLYGIKHKASGMPFLPQTKVKGLFLTGQAIVSPGIIGAILSGYLCAGAITSKNYEEYFRTF